MREPSSWVGRVVVLVVVLVALYGTGFSFRIPAESAVSADPKKAQRVRRSTIASRAIVAVLVGLIALYTFLGAGWI